MWVCTCGLYDQVCVSQRHIGVMSCQGEKELAWGYDKTGGT